MAFTIWQTFASARANACITKRLLDIEKIFVMQNAYSGIHGRQAMCVYHPQERVGGIATTCEQQADRELQESLQVGTLSPKKQRQSHADRSDMGSASSVKD